MADPLLVVGLGNPGPDYARHRHNIGFMLADRLAGGACWQAWRQGRFCRAGEALMLVKPETYMNASGEYVREFRDYRSLQGAALLACYDDLSLPLGRLRLRPKGSAGGHKGMQSLIDRLGTQEIPRLRLGIGPQPPGVDSKRFVLQNFRKDEQEMLEKAMTRACEAVFTVLRNGLSEAMNRFNPAEGPA